eukprot:7748077-Pyramimonas_sp.AAC.1
MIFILAALTTADSWVLRQATVLACFRLFKRLSSNEADPSSGMSRFQGPLKRDLGNRAYSNIADGS